MSEEQWPKIARELINAVQSNSLPTVTDWIAAVATTLTLVIAGVAAWVALGQLKEASKAREQTKALELEKTQPYVVLTMEEGLSPEFLDLVVRNYGQTAAYDVKIALDPWPRRSNDDVDVKLPEVIPVMAPGQEWRTYWDVGRERMNSELPDKHVGKVHYLGVGKVELSSDAILDWSIFKSRIWTVKYGVHDLAKAARDIRDIHKKWNESVHGGVKIFVRDGDAKDEVKAQQAREFHENRAAGPAPIRRVIKKQSKEPEVNSE